MGIVSTLLLILSFLTAGIINTIAGGGSFFTLPVLLLIGLDPRAANITSTLALFPMQVSVGYAGRDLAGGTPQLSFRTLFIVSLIGGVLGAALLLLTPSSVFAKLMPWLILFATALFAYGSFVRKPADLAGRHMMGKRGSILAQLGISIYGGYFGGGIGFLMYAALTLAGVPIRQAGATKNVLAAVMNASAVAIFLFSHDVGWSEVAIGAVCSVIGGMIGVRLLHRANEKFLRIGVVAIGSLLTIAMFVYE